MRAAEKQPSRPAQLMPTAGTFGIDS
jgi:hypothetical protein